MKILTIPTVMSGCQDEFDNRNHEILNEVCIIALVDPDDPDCNVGMSGCRDKFDNRNHEILNEVCIIAIVDPDDPDCNVGMSG